MLAGVFVTAFYSFRLYFLVFHGKERYDQNPDAHHDHDHHHGHGHDDKPHESPWVVWLPLVLLAIPSVVIGAMTLMPMLFGDVFKGVIHVDAARHPAMAELAEEIHGWLPMGLHGFVTAPFWLALAGVAAAYYMYMVNPALPAAIKRIFQPVYTVLDNKYYLDWFNENVIARGRRHDCGHVRHCGHCGLLPRIQRPGTVGGAQSRPAGQHEPAFAADRSGEIWPWRHHGV